MAEEDSSSSGRMLKLKSKEGEVFEVPYEVAVRSGTVKDLVDEKLSVDTTTEIPVDTPSLILGKVLEFCKYHAKADETKKVKKVRGEVEDEDDDDDDEDDYDHEKEKPKEADDEVSKWNKEFIPVEQSELFELLLAANYLNIKDLLTLLINTVADMICACKDPAEVRAKFNIPDDLTPDEVEDIKKKNTWAFE